MSDDVDGGRSSVIRAKAHEKLSTLNFKTQVNLPDPLDVQEADVDNLGDSSIAHNHGLTKATKVTPFTEMEFQSTGIQSRRVLSVLSAKNDRTPQNGSNAESSQTKLDELRKRPKVVDNKHVWETLSDNERASLFD